MKLYYLLRAYVRRLRMGWRVSQFRWHGARVGERVWIGSQVTTEWPFARFLEIQDDVTLGNRTNLILHDATLSVVAEGVPARFGRVTIGRGTCLGHECTVLPGVTIGEGCLIGARSLVTKDIPPHSYAFGVPAHVAGTIDELRERYLARMEKELAENDGRVAYWQVPAWHEHRLEESTVRESRDRFIRAHGSKTENKP